MTFQHLIDEMPWLYPHPEFSGQLLMGKDHGYYKLEETEERILFHMHAAHTAIEPIYFWEIQAEEQDTRQWN